MATKKSAVTEVITIKPVERLTAEIKIVGDTPLIVHAWSEKAKKEILDNQQGKKKGTKKEYRNPVAEFIRSMYWLDGMPEIPDGAKEEECEIIFNKAVESGASRCKGGGSRSGIQTGLHQKQDTAQRCILCNGNNRKGIY